MYKLNIEYDGTNYKGWQSQEGLPTIQGAIEDAVFAFCQEKTEVYGSGRTDSGVHALCMTAHVDIQKETDSEKIKMALNAHLWEESIVILSVEKTEDAFHARFDAKQRFYLYRVLNRLVPPALDVNRVWWVPQKLDIEKMREGAKHLIGLHDFSSFRASECQAKSPLKTVDNITFEAHGDEIWMRCQAKSFLHHQIRNFIGSLVDVGRGKEEPIWIKEVLEKKDRKAAGMLSPACGLYFEKVEY